AAAFAILSGGVMETGVVTRGGAAPAFAADARFLVYSITKSFLAAAALRLVAAGEMELDAPVSRWLPPLPVSPMITLRQLLRHTSGLGDYGGLPDYHAAVRRGDEPWSDAEFLRRTGNGEPLVPPGTGWAYSNVGYMLVRCLLEAVRASPYGEVLEVEIFRPLALRHTSVPTRADDLAALTFGPSAYLGGEDGPVAVAGRYHPRWVAHGVVASTAAEVARFYRALLEGELLPEPLIAEMCDPIVLGGPIPGRPVVRPGYGLGIQIDTGAIPGPVYGHTGAGPGASASAVHLRDRGGPVTVVVLSNGEDVPQVEWMAAGALAAAAAPRSG
ncbi:MAG TPA: serine hydrolase domain-containing protein, partial [Longimicrobium sp.]